MAQLKTNKLMIRLDDEINQMIDKLATRKKTTKSQVIRDAVLGLHSRTFRTSRNRHKDSAISSEVEQGGINTHTLPKQR